MSSYLKDRRLALGLSQKEVAEYIGVSEATISRYESGAIANMRRDKINLYAAILRTSPTFIMSGETESPLPRGAEPLPAMRMVPLYSAIACGTPVFADDNVEAMVPMPENAKADFAVRCKGDSMTGARIMDGDLVFIHKQPTVENGEIAAVLIGDEATLKRFYQYGDTVVLRAENPAFKELTYTGPELEQIQIMGKAVAFLSNVS